MELGMKFRGCKEFRYGFFFVLRNLNIVWILDTDFCVVKILGMDSSVLEILGEIFSVV
jgi:hypothetical protein